MSAAAFRMLLEAGDVGALRTAWARAAPHLPQPETEEQAEIVMHLTRTQTPNIAFKARAWSHRWLTERGLPSQLPDELKPKAERIYPVVVEGVGISVRSSNPLMQPALTEVRKSMEDAVSDAYSEGRTDPGFVRSRIAEARAKTYRALFGR